MVEAHARLGRISGVRGKPDPALRLWEYDRAIPAAGFLCGIDEAGRGPLAGNVVAACVVLDLKAQPISGVDDSKRLSPKAREALFPQIRERALAFGIGEATPEEIDRVNILQATFLAMRRALEAMPMKPDLLLVDGNQTVPGVDIPQKTAVGGDGLSLSVAAASILAKVTRDRAMAEWDRIYPEYGFARHKGYGTAEHRESLLRHSLSPIHRRSFCRSFLQSGTPAPA
jgi:ribonuclease HII